MPCSTRSSQQHRESGITRKRHSPTLAAAPGSCSLRSPCTTCRQLHGRVTSHPELFYHFSDHGRGLLCLLSFISLPGPLRKQLHDSLWQLSLSPVTPQSVREHAGRTPVTQNRRLILCSCPGLLTHIESNIFQSMSWLSRPAHPTVTHWDTQCFFSSREGLLGAPPGGKVSVKLANSARALPRVPPSLSPNSLLSEVTSYVRCLALICDGLSSFVT